jgi:Predicted membrane protein
MGYLESLIPFNFGVPGMKLGLANIVIVFALYYMTPLDAMLINVARIIINGLLFGNVFSIIFSIFGALFSFAVMLLLMKSKKFSIIGVSAAGGVMHNIGQLVVACFVVGALEVVYYVPVLIISGLITGLVMGIVAMLVVNNIKRIGFFKI